MPAPLEIHPSTLSSDLESLFVGQKGVDVEIDIGEDRPIGAHKCILAANSRFFEGMLTRGTFPRVFNGVGFQECNQKMITHTLMFKMKPKSFNALIRYFYSGKVEFDAEDALSIMHEYEFCINEVIPKVIPPVSRTFAEE